MYFETTSIGIPAKMTLTPDSQIPEGSSNDIQESNIFRESTSDGSGNNLASLYPLPVSLMYKGSFYEAKMEASRLNKWLIVNLQSTIEFKSSMLNRDTWSNETVKETIQTNFIFWQIYDDKEEGMKVCSYYKQISLPAVLIIDPVTGQSMCAWKGMLEAQDLLEGLLPYMESRPKGFLAHPHKHSGENVETSTTNITDKKPEDGDANKVDEDERGESTDYTEDSDEDYGVEEEEEEDDKAGEGGGGEDDHDHEEEEEEEEEQEQELEDDILSIASTPGPEYLPLPEEPKGNKDICRVAIRFPDGRKFQRNFLRTEPVKLLWPFCCFHFEEKDVKREFSLVQALPGAASKKLIFASNSTFEEADLSNSLLSLTWLQ